jgi:ATP-dependent exoDNAse (exonuclease V) alpha subunit
MVGMRQLSRISTELRRRGCKLVLVGDPDQLQPIEAGRPFAISSISSVQPDLRKSADNRRIGSAKHRGTWLPAS